MNTVNKTAVVRWDKKILGALHRVEDAFLISVLLGMVGLAVMQIVARNMLDTSYVWIDPLLQNAVLWIAMLGAMIASRNDAHIRIDVVSEYAPESWQRWLILVVDLFTAFITGLMAYYSFYTVLDERAYSTGSVAGMPDWVLQLLIPIGFGIIALRYVFLCVLGLLNKRPAPVGTESVS